MSGAGTAPQASTAGLLGDGDVADVGRDWGFRIAERAQVSVMERHIWKLLSSKKELLALQK